MKRKAVVICGVAIISLILVYFASVFWPVTKETGQAGVKTSLFFWNPADKVFEREERYLNASEDDTKLVEAALLELKAGPRNKNLIRTIPRDVSILSGALLDDEGIMELTLSDEYADMSVKDELICRGSLVWTLTEFEFIDGVKLFVSDKELTKANNTPMGLLTRTNVNVEPALEAARTEQAIITLYFASDGGGALVGEARLIYVNPNQPLEEYIIRQLMTGPISEGSLPTIPADTKLKDVSVEGNTCFIDFSPEFISKHTGGEDGWRLTVYSIVNSLAEQTNIKKVQILVDSEKIAANKLGMDISKPIEPDMTLVTQ